MTKMVQLSDEAYRRLKAQKRKGESFSDVVLRVARRAAPLDLSDLRSGTEREEVVQRLHALREAERAAMTGWQKQFDKRQDDARGRA